MPRTSSDLYKSSSCPNQANLTVASSEMLRARIVRKVTVDAIMRRGEIDIRGELISRFDAANYRFESFDQLIDNIRNYEEGIADLVDQFNRKRNQGWNIQRISYDEDTTVDFYGTPIKALFDFLLTNPETGAIHAVKIKTGKYAKALKNPTIPEAYCVAKYVKGIAEAANPDFVSEGYVDYAYIFDSSKKPKGKIAEYNYSQLEQTMDQLRASEDTTQTLSRCSGEDCGRCSMSIICNYEEPAMAEDVMRQVRSAGEITLSEEQQAVVDFREGIARVNAGPGAGKTLVVAFRVLELLRSGVPANKIALLTFTRAGAEEMIARVTQYAQEANIPFSPYDMTTGTFNSFCMNKIESFYEFLGYSAPPTLLEDSQKYEIINRILAQFPRINGWNYATYADVIKGMNGMIKSQAILEIIKVFDALKAGRTPDKVPSGVMGQLKAMFSKYQSELKRRNLIEYDDQIVLMRKLGEEVPDFYSLMGFEHIIVDEFQDTDKKQIELLREMISKNEHFKSFMAVGDDSQSIFGFRFTTPEYMINFGNYFGDLLPVPEGTRQEDNFTDLNLLTCRRCPQPIVSLANRINGLRVSRAAEAPLVTPKRSELQPVIQGFYTQEQEVKYIADSIERDLANGKDPSQIAVLTRNKNDIAAVAGELARRGVPATVCNPVPYIKDARVAAICEFWNAWQGLGDLGIAAYINAMNHGSLRDVAPEAIRTAIENFEFPEDRGLSSFVEYAHALDHIDPEGQFDACYRDFLTKIDRCRSLDELADFFRTFDLYGYKDSFRREGKYEGICITTVHSAKGLEWDKTYLTLTSFDHKEYHTHSDRYVNSGGYDEDLRLLFVGATRAKESLVMTGCYELQVVDNVYVRNQFVEKMYELLDKPYDYSPRVANVLREEARRQLEERRTTEVRLEQSNPRTRRNSRAAAQANANTEEIAPPELTTRPQTPDGLYTEQQMQDMNLSFDQVLASIAANLGY